MWCIWTSIGSVLRLMQVKGSQADLGGTFQLEGRCSPSFGTSEPPNLVKDSSCVTLEPHQSTVLVGAKSCWPAQVSSLVTAGALAGPLLGASALVVACWPKEKEEDPFMRGLEALDLDD